MLAAEVVQIQEARRREGALVVDDAPAVLVDRLRMDAAGADEPQGRGRPAEEVGQQDGQLGGAPRNEREAECDGSQDDVIEELWMSGQETHSECQAAERSPARPLRLVRLHEAPEERGQPHDRVELTKGVRA